MALAAWMVLLGQRGIWPSDPDLRAAVEGVEDEATGGALVAAVRAAVADADPEAVLAFAQAQYGPRAEGSLGQGDREARTRGIRRYQFTANTPWLARIYERYAGVVQPTWLLVSRVTDEVLLMDPDPYDGVEEERVLPVADFMVLWELDGCASVSLAAEAS